VGRERGGWRQVRVVIKGSDDGARQLERGWGSEGGVGGVEVR